MRAYAYVTLSNARICTHTHKCRYALSASLSISSERVVAGLAFSPIRQCRGALLSWSWALHTRVALEGAPPCGRASAVLVWFVIRPSVCVATAWHAVGKDDGHFLSGWQGAPATFAWAAGEVTLTWQWSLGEDLGAHAGGV